MTTGDAILFLATFALFVVLMLAAIVWVGHMTRRAGGHYPPKDEEEVDDAERD